MKRMVMFIVIVSQIFFLNGCMTKRAAKMYSNIQEMQNKLYEDYGSKFDKQYVKTSDKTFKPRNENDSVKVALTTNIPDYSEIGVLTITPYLSDYDPLEKIVIEAKKDARMYGGDIVILYKKEKNTSLYSTTNPTASFANTYRNAYQSISSSTTSLSSSTKITYIFIIGQLKK